MPKEKLTLVFDLEANGLLDEADKIWCGVFKVLGADQRYIFCDKGYPYVNYCIVGFRPFLEKMASVYDLTLVSHNLYGYDLPMLRKLANINFSWGMLAHHPVNFVDTLDLSRRLTPDRPLPGGCPTSVPDPVTGKRRQIGPHSLEAWGFKLGNHKPVIHDWQDGNVEDYLYRCEEDVKITEALYNYLLEEFKRRGGYLDQ